MKKFISVMFLSLFAVNASAWAEYDTQACLDKLAAQGMNGCSAQAGQTTDYQCMNFGDSSAMQGYCSGKEPYTPVQMSEAFNAKTGDAQTFATTETMLQFLSANPDYQMRNCYCCC